MNESLEEEKLASSIVCTIMFSMMGRSGIRKVLSEMLDDSDVLIEIKNELEDIVVKKIRNSFLYK